MHIHPKLKIQDLITKYDFMLDYLVELSPKFKLLRNPVARKTVGAIATLGQAASIGGLTVDKLLKNLADKITAMTGEKVSWSIEDAAIENIKDAPARQEVLKEIIRDLHAGADMESVKKRFRELIKDVDASEIAKMEQALIKEGMPDTEVKKLCDVHVQVFKESLEATEIPVVEEGHPVHTFMLENRAAENIMNKIETICTTLENTHEGGFGPYVTNLEKLITSLKIIDLHFLRKENQLFPHLEKIDITGPTQVMWALDDDIRGMLKKTEQEFRVGDKTAFNRDMKEAIQTIRDMIYKEEHILFPVCVDKIADATWKEIRRGEGEIGFAWIEPVAQTDTANSTSVLPKQSEGEYTLDTGVLSLEQINLIFKHLPVDISFVDENDTVRYYSATKERIFPRSPAVIGRKVQNCHPSTSVHVVQGILDDFKSGSRSTAEFWIQMQGKFIHIRYFAVRNETGIYKGCLEVSQEVTGIRNLEGERRLLD